MKTPDAGEPENLVPGLREEEEEEVDAHWGFKLTLTVIPFLLVGALFFLDRCTGR